MPRRQSKPKSDVLVNQKMAKETHYSNAVLEPDVPEHLDNLLVVPPAPLTTPLPPADRLDEVWNAMLEVLGSCDEITEALIHEGSADSINLAILLTTNTGDSITRKCRKVNMVPAKLSNIIRRYQMSKAQNVIMKRLPAYAESVMGDSMTQIIECPRCDGLGEVPLLIPKGATESPGNRICPRCEGTGKWTQPGDTAAREIVATTVGFINSKQAPAVVVNFGTNVESVASEIERHVGFMKPTLPSPSDTIIDIKKGE